MIASIGTDEFILRGNKIKISYLCANIYLKEHILGRKGSVQSVVQMIFFKLSASFKYFLESHGKKVFIKKNM